MKHLGLEVWRHHCNYRDKSSCVFSIVFKSLGWALEVGRLEDTVLFADRLTGGLIWPARHPGRHGLTARRAIRPPWTSTPPESHSMDCLEVFVKGAQ